MRYEKPDKHTKRNWRHERSETPAQERAEHRRRRHPQKGGYAAVRAAKKDFAGLYSGAKRIAHQGA